MIWRSWNLASICLPLKLPGWAKDCRTDLWPNSPTSSRICLHRRNSHFILLDFKQGWLVTKLGHKWRHSCGGWHEWIVCILHPGEECATGGRMMPRDGPQGTWGIGWPALTAHLTGDVTQRKGSTWSPRHYKNALQSCKVSWGPQTYTMAHGDKTFASPTGHQSKLQKGALVGEVVHQGENGGGLLLHLISHGPSKWKWIPVPVVASARCQVDVQSCCRRLFWRLSICYFSKFNKHQINLK